MHCKKGMTAFGGGLCRMPGIEHRLTIHCTITPTQEIIFGWYHISGTAGHGTCRASSLLPEPLPQASCKKV